MRLSVVFLQATTGTHRSSTARFEHHPSQGTVFLNATGTLQDRETYKITAMNTYDIPDGGTLTYKQVSHYQTNHQGGNLNWNVTGHMIGSNEFQEDFVNLAITCD
jgi:hypothetical protein